MTDLAYMQSRIKYQRPQAILFADNPGTKVNDVNGSYYIPDGVEDGATIGNSGNFIILSDDNRKDIQFTPNRIEQRERMINGRMRSYHIADKLKISISWDMLPSRGFALTPGFSISNDTRDNPEYTSDGGAGGVDILKWYDNNQGSFWVYLAYDKHTNFGNNDAAYTKLDRYNQIIEVFFADMQYSVVKRGGTNYDFWNISLSLEEV